MSKTNDIKTGKQLGELLTPFVLCFYFFLLAMFMVVLVRIGYFLTNLLW